MEINKSMTLDSFKKNTKAMRFIERVQHTGNFKHTRQCGVMYQIYVCVHTMEVINPYSKKNKGREYKCFYSSVSADHAKEQAYEYIMKNI